MINPVKPQAPKPKSSKAISPKRPKRPKALKPDWLLVEGEGGLLEEVRPSGLPASVSVLRKSCVRMASKASSAGNLG